MKEINQMSIKEISECLEISESNVKVRLHRAKSQIKDNLYSSQSKESIFEFGNSKCDNIVENVMRMIS